MGWEAVEEFDWEKNAAFKRVRGRSAHKSGFHAVCR